MANIQRLAQAALFAALLFLAQAFTNAHAETVPVGTIYQAQFYPPYYTSPNGACAGGPLKDYQTGQNSCATGYPNTVTYSITSASPSSCTIHRHAQEVKNGESFVCREARSDIQINIYQSTGCATGDGFQPDGNGGCTRPDPPPPPLDCSTPEKDLSGQPFGGAGTLPSNICVPMPDSGGQGCSYPITSGTQGCKNGSCYFEGIIGTAGEACTPSETGGGELKNDDNRTPEEKCISQGQGYIETGGVVSCVGAGTPGGGDITVDDNSVPGSNPVEFGNDGGVDTDGDGAADKTKQEYCNENPASAQCKGSFSGSCGSGFRCEGDAANCAIAKKLHQDRCDDHTSLAQYTQAIERGNSLLNGELGADVDGFIAGSAEHTTNVNLPQQLSESGQANLGSGGLADLSVAVMGNSITIPFSKLNSILEMLGYIILAAAYVSALRIVGVF